MVAFKLAFFDSIQARVLLHLLCQQVQLALKWGNELICIFLYIHTFSFPLLLNSYSTLHLRKNTGGFCNFFRVRQRSPKKILIVFYGPLSHQPENFLMLLWNKPFSSRTISTIAVKILNASPDPDICFSVNLNGPALLANGTVLFCNTFSDTWECSVVSDFLTEVKDPDTNNAKTLSTE